MMENWGTMGHSEAQHRYWDVFYSGIPAIMKETGKKAVEVWGKEKAAVVLERSREVMRVLVAKVDTCSRHEYGAQLYLIGAVAIFLSYLDPEAGAASCVAAVEAGLFESIATEVTAAGDDSLSEAWAYAMFMPAEYVLPGALADPATVKTTLESGWVQFLVDMILDRMAAGKPAHVLAVKSISQGLSRLAALPDGVAVAVAPRLPEALQWLLCDSGFDPIGQKFPVDAAGSAANALALLYGRNEDASLTLPAAAIHKLCDLFTVFLSTVPALAVPYAQGLAEVVISDAHKVSLSENELIVPSRPWDSGNQKLSLGPKNYSPHEFTIYLSLAIDVI